MDSTYGHFIKEIPITSGGGSESFSFGTLMEKPFFGFDKLSVRLGICGKEGPIIEEVDAMHTHDYDQLLFFFSTDADDMLLLGGEVEMAIGEEGERFRFYTPTGISIPKGMPHSPPFVRSVDRPFYFMSISIAPECKATPVATELKQDSGPLATFRSKLRQHVMALSFRYKSGYSYGSEAFEDSGGLFVANDGSNSGLEMTVSWESIKTAHTMGPRTPALTHAPHVHPFDEVLLFLNADAKDPFHLGVEAEICYGKELEPHKITTPSATMFPVNLLHCPMSFKTPDKPLFFVVISCAGAHH